MNRGHPVPRSGGDYKVIKGQRVYFMMKKSPEADALGDFIAGSTRLH